VLAKRSHAHYVYNRKALDFDSVRSVPGPAYLTIHIGVFFFQRRYGCRVRTATIIMAFCRLKDLFCFSACRINNDDNSVNG
jgi:hypothetical protein